jgi:hypothetical protein
MGKGGCVSWIEAVLGRLGAGWACLYALAIGGETSHLDLPTVLCLCVCV